MVDKIISDYIAENKRLIVPNFGAFLKGKDGAIRFVELLKNNDGILISLVCKELSIDQAKANVVISNFITKIKQDIAIDGEYVISGIGSLTSTSDGLYRLANQTATTTKSDSFTNEPPIEKQKINNQEITEAENKKYTSTKITPKKRMDFIMIFAIITAIIALIVLVYGFIITNNGSIPFLQDNAEQQVIESVE